MTNAEEMESRLRIVYVDKRDVLSVFGNAHSEDRECLSLPRLKLPDGYKIRDVAFCWERDAFGFKVQHESFSPVPEGGQIPQFVGDTESMRTTYRRPEPLVNDAEPATPPKWGWEFLGSPK